MENRIVDFINKQSCISLCCVDEEQKPHIFTCFYTFDAEQGFIYFKSNEDTLHAKILLNNSALAGSILPNKLDVLKIKGIQLEGEYVDEEDFNSRGKKMYYKQHPYALGSAGRIWCVKLNMIKMTDNTLFFGEKIYWNRN